MLSIQEELAKIRREREDRFILISDLLNYLKVTNPNSSYQEIATFLLIKFRPNDIRYADEELWGNEAYNYWYEQNGIAVFKLFDELDYPPEFEQYEVFFDFLEDVKKYPFVVENSVKEVFEDSNETYARIAVERTRIEELLGVKLPISELVENEYRKDIIFNVSAALTKTEEFIKNIDINKSPVGLAERLVFQEEIKQKNAKIVELENQNAELKIQLENNPISKIVNYEDFSIYGHTSENIKILFEIAKKITELCDPDEPHSYPSKEDVMQYVKSYFSDSGKLGEAIYQIVTPEKVKVRGKRPKDIEPFKGFIDKA